MTDDALPELAGILLDALSGLPDLSIVVFDAHLVIRSAAGGAASRHGYDLTGMIGQRLPDVTPPTAWAELADAYDRTLAGESTTRRYTMLDGAEVYEMQFAPVRDEPGGRVVGGTATSREVSVRHRAEQYLDQRRQVPVQGNRLEVFWEFAKVTLDGKSATISCPALGGLAGTTAGDLEARLRELLSAELHDDGCTVTITRKALAELTIVIRTEDADRLAECARSGILETCAITAFSSRTRPA